MKKIDFLRFLFLAVSGILFFNACTKNEDNAAAPPDAKTPTVSLSFGVDSRSFLFDTIKYFNAAGNNYGVTRLQFYVSAFEFENTDGVVSKFDDVFYVDARTYTNKSFTFSNLPYGNYKRIKFLIGLDSAHNVENGLPNTVDNYNMVWPSTMGGGYHFMKFEGKFMSNDIAYGFAMHVGKNKNLVTISITKDFSISSETAVMNLKMNLNEWFVHPNVYNFNVDGNYSMADSAALAKLALNGTDVFTLN